LQDDFLKTLAQHPVGTRWIKEAQNYASKLNAKALQQLSADEAAMAWRNIEALESVSS
jgi:hypothetical protein